MYKLLCVSREVSGIVPRTLWTVMCLLICLSSMVYGHGRLWEPPSRSSMWRRGYNTTVNMDDNELSCGGFMNHWILNGGRCGVCGDPYQQQPRDNEHGGKYASGLITRTYPVGAIMEVVVGLTANHGGSFEFKLCPLPDTKTPETQSCMDQHALRILNTETGQASDRYDISNHLLEGEVRISVMLPPRLYCAHCVLQWKYRTGTRWGCDVDDVCGHGLGPQEEFYGCSDIAIADVPNTIYFVPKQADNQDRVGLNDLGSVHQRDSTSESQHMIKPEIKFVVHKEATATGRKGTDTAGIKEPSIYRPTVATHVINSLHDDIYMENLLLQSIRNYYDGNTESSHVRSKHCTAAPLYSANPIINEWCRNTCPRQPEICPRSVCSCQATYSLHGTVQIPDGNTFTNQHELRSFAKRLINKGPRYNAPARSDSAGDARLFKVTLPVPRDFYQSPKVSLMKTEVLRAADASTNDIYKQTSPIRRVGLPIPLEEIIVPKTERVAVPPVPPIRGLDTTQNEMSSRKMSDVNSKNKASRDTQHPGITCTGSALFSHNKDMTEWCTTNCLFGFCPKSVCSCKTGFI